MNNILQDLNIPQNNAIAALSILNKLAGTRVVEVDLPVLKEKVFISPIDGADELAMNTMRASGAAFIKSFNELLFAHCKFEGVEFANVEDFQKHLTPPDKAMIVYGLLSSTFTKLPEKHITCPKCGKADNYTFPPEKMMHADTIPKTWNEDKNVEDFTIESEIMPGFKVFFGMPTEQDRLDVLTFKANAEMRANLQEVNDVLSSLEIFSLYIKRIEIQDGKKTVIKLVNKVTEILPVLKQMPPEIKSQLLEDLSMEPLIEYSPNFYIEIQCGNPGCNHVFKWDDIRPEQDFFRKALSVYN